MVICLERGADLHMAQLMPLPLTVSCFSKIQIGFTFLVPAHPGSTGKRAVKRVRVCVLLLLKTLICLTADCCCRTSDTRGASMIDRCRRPTCARPSPSAADAIASPRPRPRPTPSRDRRRRRPATESPPAGTVTPPPRSRRTPPVSMQLIVKDGRLAAWRSG